MTTIGDKFMAAIRARTENAGRAPQEKGLAALSPPSASEQPEPIPNFWQPIVSAPEDGTLFVALSQDTGGNGLPPFVSLCSWHPDAGFCTDELREPTHWMAVPNLSPPCTSEQSAPKPMRDEERVANLFAALAKGAAS